MTTLNPALCAACTHLNDYACDAFPDGVPDRFLIEGGDHRLPADGDHGVQFEQRDTAEARRAFDVWQLVWQPSLTSSAFHLPGKHNQKAHAHGRMSEEERASAVTGDEVLSQMKSYADLPPKLRTAAENYQNGADKFGRDWYQAQNSWLRNKSGNLDEITRDAPKHISAGITNLDKAINSSTLHENIKVYKGIANGSRTFGSAWSTGDMTGVKVTNHAYSSTSSDPVVGRRFSDKMWDPYGAVAGKETPTVLNVYVLKGSKALTLTDKSRDPNVAENVQKEVLLPRGSTFFVIGDHGVIDGVRYLDVEV